MSLIVDLNTFSELCGVTGETMRGYIRSVPDGTGWLIERGDRGRPFQIEAEGGVAWWKALRDSEQQAEQAHKEALAQLRFDLIGGAVEQTETLQLSGKQRTDEINAALMAIKLRKTMGGLLEYDEIQHELGLAVTDLRRALMLLPGEAGVKFQLTPETVAGLRDMIGRKLDDFAVRVALPAPSDAD